MATRHGQLRPWRVPSGGDLQQTRIVPPRRLAIARPLRRAGGAGNRTEAVRLGLLHPLEFGERRGGVARLEQRLSQ